VIAAVPANTYFAKPLDLLADPSKPRALRGGTGHVKAGPNYAPTFHPLVEARQAGGHEILHMDAETGRCPEEAGSSNFFLVLNRNPTTGQKGACVYTPSLRRRRILPGNNREACITLCRHQLKLPVVQGHLRLSELLPYAVEGFTTGTAATVAPIGSITYRGRRKALSVCPDTVTERLRSLLIGIQTGELPDRYGWVEEIK
jgi:branched-chain amino acid aminotransferase